MKSDKNMTDNVLMRVTDIKLQKKHQKKIAVKTLSVAFAFIFVFMAGVTLFNNGAQPDVAVTDTQNETVTEKAVNKTFSLVVASAAENTEVFEINKEIGVTIPFGGLLYVKDAPIKVVVDEAVELAKKYSTEDSSSFVNGILAKVIVENGLK